MTGVDISEDARLFHPHDRASDKLGTCAFDSQCDIELDQKTLSSCSNAGARVFRIY